MFRKPIVLLAGMLLLCLSGCDMVLTDRPIGDSMPEKELQQLVGRWLDESEQVVFETRLSKKQEIILGGLEWNEELDQFKVEQHTLRRIGKN
jgi:hypothetical protein